MPTSAQSVKGAGAIPAWCLHGQQDQIGCFLKSNAHSRFQTISLERHIAVRLEHHLDDKFVRWNAGIYDKYSFTCHAFFSLIGRNTPGVICAT